MISKSVAIAGGLGLAFVGYCVYFDHKRRSHPDYRKRVIESKSFRLVRIQELVSTIFFILKEERRLWLNRLRRSSRM